MDIFSGVRSIQNSNNYDKIDVKSNNINQMGNQINKNETIKEDDFSKKSKEEIKKELQDVINELNSIMNPLNLDLKFKFNDKVDELVVQVIDKKNDRVIREFPPKEALKLMEKMRELVGMLFDEKG